MMYACISGDVTLLRQWGRRGVRVTSAEPLLQSAMHCKIAVMMCLVKELCADVNGADEDGRTAVFVAAQRGHEAVVRYLVKVLGARVDQATHKGCTPLYMAAGRGHATVVLCLVKELRACVNLTDESGGTPLYIASQQGHEAVVLCLVKKCGADVNQADDHGCTPLYAGSRMNHEATVLVLVKECGADVNLANYEGSTPLMIAAQKQHEKVIKILLKHGADPKILHPIAGTAADTSKAKDATAELTAYLEAKTHCSNPGCTGAGRKTCAECKQARYCCVACQHAHWPAHKAECKVAAKARGKGK
jgi:hypothetical protein